MTKINRIEVHAIVFSKETGKTALSETEIANIINNALSEAGVAYALPASMSTKIVTKEEFEQEADRDYDEIFSEEEDEAR